MIGDCSEQSPKLSSVSSRDVAPKDSKLEESNMIGNEITDLALQLQSQAGVKVLWVTCNLFAHPQSVFLHRFLEEPAVVCPHLRNILM